MKRWPHPEVIVSEQGLVDENAYNYYGFTKMIFKKGKELKTDDGTLSLE